MGELLKKPYEISIWEDRLVEEEGKSYYKEIKLAVIGSSEMDRNEFPGRVYKPIFNEKVNGEKTLTFTLTFKYYDELKGENVENPFYSYLINERKVKLFYNDEWFEFVIKECEEDSESNEFTYTAKELFSLELSKVGYDVVLDSSLNNNQGTATELAKKVLENTDWEVDEENSDILRQLVQEPLYVATTINNFTAINLDTNENAPIEAGETIYLFYSDIANRIVENVQFLRASDNLIPDDDDVLMGTNYRFIGNIEYTPIEGTPTGIDGKAQNLELYYLNQGYRLVYKNQTLYDPVTNRTVDLYKVSYEDGEQEIYHYTDYKYVTSDVVTSYLTNGFNFNIYDNGNLQGWYNQTIVEKGGPLSENFTGNGEDYDFTLSIPAAALVTVTVNGETISGNRVSLDGEGKVVTFRDAPNDGDEIVVNFTPKNGGNTPVLQPMSLVTYPELSAGSGLTLIKNFAEIAGYLELKFNGVLDNQYRNAYFNSGFEDNISMIDHISAGEQFALRLRYFTSDTKHGPLVAGPRGGIKAIVAKYDTVDFECFLDKDDLKQDEPVPTKVKAYKINPGEIVFNFNEEAKVSKNIISNGNFNEAHNRYLVDKVIQVPSTLYIYKEGDDGQEYVWNPKAETFERKTESYSDYYMIKAPARISYSNEKLREPEVKLGVFIYIDDPSLVGKYIYLQDIQLTRYYETSDKEPIIMGNVPVAESIPTDFFYLKPLEGMTESDINTYGDLDFLAKELGIDSESIEKIYNNNCEKILSIQASNSNCFNILQSICEVFECWLDIEVKHKEDGSIRLDKNFNPIKKVAFKEYAGKDNFSGFKKGINLSSINRTIDSNEIVTKLIVDPVQSEYTDVGSVDIQHAKSNPSGQSYIFNFNYYLSKGLISNKQGCKEDLQEFNDKLSVKNKEYNELAALYSQSSLALSRVGSKVTDFDALIDEANATYNKALEKFRKATGLSYEKYVSEYNTIEEWAEDKNYDLTKNDSILEIIAEIYAASVTLNNYSGILTNQVESYKKTDLKTNGAKTYSVSIATIPPTEEQPNTFTTQVVLDDYISGVKFKLIDENGGEVVYQTSPNDRIFEVSGAQKYISISFISLPDDYDLQYYENNKLKTIYGNNALNVSFSIYSADEDKFYNKRFKIVPNEEYAATYLGYKKKLDKLIEEKKEIEKDFYKKYSRFIQEGTWSSQDYVDPELYYLDALQVSNTSAKPQISYTFNVLEVSQLENLNNYDFRIGDKTFIEDVDFFGYSYDTIDDKEIRTPIKEEVIVSEIEWHLDEPDTNTITIQNYKTQFEDLFQRISAAVQTVQRNEITYPKTTSILDTNGLLNSKLLSDSISSLGDNGFALTSNGSVVTTQDGLLIRDLLNTANVIKLTGGTIKLSSDGGTTWNTALTSEGISADRITAGTINTQNIWIMDGNNPSFRWDKAGLSAYGLDRNGEPGYDLNTYVRFDKYGLYGIKNGENFVASSLEDIQENAHFAVTWDGFFVRNSYEGGGRVGMSSDNDFQITNKVNGVEQEKIKIGALEWVDNSGNIVTTPLLDRAPIKYGIRIKNNNGITVMETDDNGNITMTGTINAVGGNFDDLVTVGNNSGGDPYIAIDGRTAEIYSSNYSDGAGTGWLINKDGDAYFNNITARGAIKTAVFEYAEIQAVGGIFIFRPSSTIKSARVDNDDLILKVEKPYLFTKVTYTRIDNPNPQANPHELNWYEKTDYGYQLTEDTSVQVKDYYIQDKTYNGSWCKISNYTSDGIADDSTIQNILLTNGLTHVYQVTDVDFETKEVTLAGAAVMVEGPNAVTTLDELEGGALIDMGRTDGSSNYGIGVNSSDNTVNLPARAISLFETEIDETKNPKVSYNYRGIFGTLPELPPASVNTNIYNNMVGTQGIYTDNMYLGDLEQFLAFYTDKETGEKKLRISAAELMFEIPDEHGQGSGQYQNVADIEAEGVPGPPGEDAITVKVDSTAGILFVNDIITSTLVCTVEKGGVDITNNPNYSIYYTWKKRLNDGSGYDPTWGRPLEHGNRIDITSQDIENKGIFECEVIIQEV